MIDFEITDDPARIDRDAAYAYLSEHVYWGRWRTRADFDVHVDGAWRVVGAFADGRMIGFARALSDGLALAYLADVYVEDAYRGHKIGEALVRAMIDEGPGKNFRWMLHTSDAHGLYGKFGFAKPDDSYMERPASSRFGYQER
ncbi:GNAT family N-acetyltransferase [Longispora albida]|uniref:GNAT family N-acetyltransferase n=1 Tax=Longispora albida TaxID=203523 RepID=UPI0003651BC4|nr:GNAT family N-acetyltransferase [Longispora albida]